RRERPDRCRTAARSGGEELDDVQAQLEGGLDLGRGHGPGQREDAVLTAAFDDGSAEPGRDDVARACGDRSVDLVDREDRARAYEHVAAGRDRPDRVLR